MLKLEDFKSNAILSQENLNGGLAIMRISTDTGDYKLYMYDDGSFELEGPPVQASGER